MSTLSHAEDPSHALDHALALRGARHQRGQLKATLTRFERFLDTRPYPDAVALRTKRIEGTLAAFERVQREIDLTSNNLDEGEVEMAEFEERYDAVLLRAARMSRPRSDSASTERIATDLNPHQGTQIAATKLPPLAVPIFNGEYLQWEAFRDMFISLVHSNTRLSNVQKFHYLKGNLRGDALALVDAYALTDANYLDAWRALTENFNNERVLLQNHWRTFAALKPIQGDSAPELKALSQGVARMHHALQAMNREQSAWEDWRVFFIVDRLDAASRREWETSLGHSTAPPSFALLDAFIKGRIQMLEALPSSRPRQPAYTSRALPPPRPARAHLAGAVPSGDPCPNCTADHYIGHCPNFQSLSVSQRRTRVGELKLCFNCLRFGHARDACPSSRSCVVCRERHHTTLHLSTSKATVGIARRQTKSKRTAPPSKAAIETPASAEQPVVPTPSTSTT